MFGVSLHRLLIHFPISLAIVACGYDAWAVYSRESRFHAVGSDLLKLAAVAAVAAAGTGLDLAGMSGLGSSSPVTGHAGLAILATLVLVATAVMRYSSEVRSDSPRFSTAWLAAEIVAAVLIAAAAVVGHTI